MAKDLARREPAGILNPRTGELVPPEPARAAALLAELRAFKDAVQDAIRAAEQVLIDESVRQGAKTLRYGRLVAKISGGPERDYDVAKLRAGLERAGCPPERIDELVRTEVSYKVNGTVARQLAGSNPRYKKAIDAARFEVPKPLRVSTPKQEGAST